MLSVNCGWTGLPHGSTVGRTGFFPVLTFFPAGAGRSRNMLSARSQIRYENLTKPDTLMESGNVHFMNNIYYSTFLGLIKGEFKLFAFL